MTSKLPRASLTDQLLGQILANRYLIEHRVAEGAMGTVYRARHVRVGRAFAVKVLHPYLLADETIQQRFEREAEISGRLTHPNVVGVVDVGETADGLRYMVMDFVEGPDLGSLMSEAPMPAKRIIRLTRQMLEGLYHAHEEGLIHRDFKPENVIVEHDTHGDEVPRIVDFGIAILREVGESSDSPDRLTTNGLVLGTLRYMAPEQAVADPIDHRIDLFALGIMVYEMLSGKPPFDGSGVEVARANQLLDPPKIADRVPYLNVDPLLEAFARRLMSKKREHRPPTAKAARELLDLIDRDPRAAAAALAGPLSVAATQKTTQEVRSRLVRDSPGTSSPPIREATATSPRAPRMEGPIAVAVSLPSREQPTSTQMIEAVEPPGRKLVIGAIAGCAVLAVVIAILASGGSSKQAAPARPPMIAEVTPTPVETKPAPTPVPPVEIKPAVPPPIETAPITKPIEHHVITKPIAKHVQSKPVQTITKRVETQPEVKPTTKNDVASFTAQFSSVGAELKAFAAAYRENQLNDLQVRYRDLTFGVAVSTQAKRDAAALILSELHDQLVARKPK